LDDLLLFFGPIIGEGDLFEGSLNWEAFFFSFFFSPLGCSQNPLQIADWWRTKKKRQPVGGGGGLKRIYL